MRFKVIELKGIGPQAAKALEKAGYYYAEQLLKMNVAEVAKKTGLEAIRLQTWQDYVKMMKLKGIGPNYANLLHRDDVGIANLGQLAKANPEDLLKKLTASNKKRHLVKVLPTLKKIQRWIEEAKKV